MEITVKITNKRLYKSFTQLLRSLNIEIVSQKAEAKDKSSKKLAKELKGTVLQYNDPFGPAVLASDWEAMK